MSACIYVYLYYICIHIVYVERAVRKDKKQFRESGSSNTVIQTQCIKWPPAMLKIWAITVSVCYTSLAGSWCMGEWWVFWWAIGRQNTVTWSNGLDQRISSGPHAPFRWVRGKVFLFPKCFTIIESCANVNTARLVKSTNVFTVMAF